MRFRTILIAALALVAGLAAALVAQQTLQEWRRQTAVKTAPVVVTTAEIPRGMAITEKQVAIAQWPKTLIPSGALGEVNEAVGRVALSPQPAGHPLWAGELSPKNVKGGLAAIVPEGMRAYTIHTPTVASGVAGFVLPGNKVDVYLTLTSPNPFTVMLLQNLEILAVDQQLESNSERKADAKSLKSVTLLVTPDQGARLSLAQRKGELHLALRNPSDSQDANSPPVTLSDLELPPALLAQITGQPLPVAESRQVEPPESNPEPKATPAAREPVTLTFRTMRGNQTGGVVWRSAP